jgi:hypothetical protein
MRAHDSARVQQRAGAKWAMAQTRNQHEEQRVQDALLTEGFLERVIVVKLNVSHELALCDSQLSVCKRRLETKLWDVVDQSLRRTAMTLDGCRTGMHPTWVRTVGAIEGA